MTTPPVRRAWPWREALLGTAIVAVPSAMVWDMARRDAPADLSGPVTPGEGPGAGDANGRARVAGPASGGAVVWPAGVPALPGARLIGAGSDETGGRQARHLVTRGTMGAVRDRLVDAMRVAGLRVDGVVATEAMTLIAAARPAQSDRALPFAVQAILTPVPTGVEVTLSWTTGTADAADAAAPSLVGDDARR